MVGFREDHTKNKEVQAFVGHEFIYQDFFLFLSATTQELYKIAMLKSCYQYNFIFELYRSLPGILRKPFYCNFFPSDQCTLRIIIYKVLKLVSQISSLQLHKFMLPCTQVQNHLLPACCCLKSHWWLQLRCSNQIVAVTPCLPCLLQGNLLCNLCF